jgi:HAMP domain-containing protein
MQGRRGGSEVRKVLIVWVVLFLVISAVSVAVLVYSSISLLNGKTQALKEDVAKQTGDYYKNALDSTLEYVSNNPGVLVGQELWDPDPNAPINREQTLERMRGLLKTSFNADYVAYITDGKVKYTTEASNVLPGMPDSYSEGYRVIHGLERDGDTYISLCKKTDYPLIGPEDQYIFTLVNITRQTDAITALYQDSRSQLLWSQLIISLILLLLSMIFAPLGIAWAVRKYVAAPILELDDLSKQIIEGTLQGEVEVDEASSFADIQRLLRGAQELLRNI